MISPTGSMDNCSATVPFNPCDASHDVPIRRHNDCAQRKRLHGHGQRCTSTIAPTMPNGLCAPTTLLGRPGIAGPDG